MLDITVIGFLIGQGIGRWGNFVNQEAFGTNTANFLGMSGGRIQQTILSQTQMGGEMYNNGLATMMWENPVHPCFLYESVWCLLGFVLLAFWSKRRKYDGQLLLMYMAWYGAERFVVEGLRTDSLMLGNIRVSQALSALLFIASVILQIIFFFRRKRDPESFVLYSSTEESRLLIEAGRKKRMGMTGSDAVMMIDEDDDEVGILPPEDDDDDDAGILPPEDDDEEEAAESVEEKAEEAAESVEEKAEEAAESVEEKAEEAAETVEEKAEEITEAAEDKYEELAHAVDEKLSGGGSRQGPHNKKKRRK